MTYEIKIREERREAHKEGQKEERNNLILKGIRQQLPLVTLESLFDIKEEEIREMARENHIPINESRA